MPAVDIKSGNSKDILFTAQSLKQAVKQNRDLIVFKQQVYDITKFTKFHPGGQLAIKHLVGKDATDAILVFHPPSVYEKQMAHYKVGVYSGRADELESDYDDVIVNHIGQIGSTSHVQGQKELSYDERVKLAYDFRALNDQIRALGFYKPDYWFYARRFVGFALWWMAASYVLIQNPNSIFNVLVSAVMFGGLWHMAAFTAHDAGHHSVTCNRKYDDIIGILISSFLGGLSIGWWRYNHNVHHIVTNEPEHDPDIQHMPIFAVSKRFMHNLYSSFYNRVMEFDDFAKKWIPFQHFMYYPVMTFGRFNLYFLSLSYLLNFKSPEKRVYRWFELTGICFFWAWYGYWLVYTHFTSLPLAILFIYVSHAATLFLHVQITLSHFAMSTELQGYETFYEKGLRTTMNVDCPEWLDWFHGGLQFQIEHHLFPRVPRCYFRKLSPMIKKFCKEHQLNYYSFGFVKGNGIVLGALREVGNHVSLVMNGLPTTK